MSKSRPKIVNLPVSELVEDMEFYPRHSVDASHVTALALALESGAELPAIVADKKSKRIVDGWHRVRAYKRVNGVESTVRVELVSYKNDAAMKLDAVKRNAEHGRRLDASDRTRSALMLESAGLKVEIIAAAMHMPESQVLRITLKTAKGSSGAHLIPGTRKIALKGSVGHLAGTTLTKSQAEAHDSMPGSPLRLAAKQLYLALREDMANMDDKLFVAQLVALRDMLIEKLR